MSSTSGARCADLAELIWRMLAAGKTQQAVANELGWSRGQVSNYALLQSIDPKAWNIIATAAREFSAPREDGDVAEGATAVAPFTENLLRVLIPLSAEARAKRARA